jgi:hypothetical protein
MKEAYDRVDSAKIGHFKFTKKEKLKILVCAYGIALKTVNQIYRDRLKEGSHLTYLMNIKQELESEFKDECKSVDQSLRAASRLVRNVIKDIIVNYIKLTKGEEIHTWLRNHSELSHKNKLMFEMLKELLTASTSTIVEFTSDFKGFADEWILNQAVTFCTENNYLMDWLKHQIEFTISTVVDVLYNVAKKEQRNPMDIKSWWVNFKTDLEKKTCKVSLSCSIAGLC